jgi:hypothetical protein
MGKLGTYRACFVTGHDSNAAEKYPPLSGTKQSCHPDVDPEFAKGKRKDLLLHFIVPPIYGTSAS